MRGQYTQEFNLEAVRLVKTGQSGAMTAEVLGLPKGNLRCGSASADNLEARANGR